jgi:GH35 family endo-1,4-beta-xylanase
MACSLFFASAIFAFSAAATDTQDEIFARLPPGKPVLGTETPVRFQLGGRGGTSSNVAVAGERFATAMRIVTTTRPAAVYGLQVTARNTVPVEKGDRLLAVFWGRAIPPLPAENEARTEFVFELAREPFTKSVSYAVALTPAWRKFYIPFEAKRSIAAGEAQAIFRAGYDPQTIEIGGFQLLDYGRILSRDALPYTPTTYAGREPDAPWRKAAAARIESLRKADATIRVLNRAGKAMVGVQVSVRMKKHAFGFGTAVDARTLIEERGADGEKYREMLQANFNKAVIENHLKWPSWERVESRATGVSAVDWLNSKGFAVRGHCLVWPGKRNLPRAIVALFAQPEALRKAILEHIADEAGALRGKVVAWDVVNEPFSNHDVQDILGAECLRDWFVAAHTADPGARLFINDYSILESGGKDTAHQDHYFSTIQSLLAVKAPVQGIGIQGHFDENLTAIPRLFTILDRFAAFGLPIEITEFDINTSDEALQGDYTRDFLTAMFSHPSIASILTWGFWEGRHWIPNGALWRRDWSARPAGAAWRDLIFKQWWTNAAGKTDASGALKMRGFLGDYEVEASADGKTARQTWTLKKESAPLVITLD